jgi:aminotransferase EvaB
LTKVRYSPLLEQYSDPEKILDGIREIIATGDYTLGKVVSEFEDAFSKRVSRKHSIGVGSGTDAIKIPLRALEIGFGDEVITAANTFWATVGAIAEVGATPVFVDCGPDMQIDVEAIEASITKKTKAIVPVHIAGNVVRMDRIMEISEKYGLAVVEDGCQSLMAERNGSTVGSWGIATAYSMHPLKVINVWGDAGVVVTDDDEIDRKVRLLRNHGLRNRDEMEMLGYNSRLDSIQAVVGKEILSTINWIISERRSNADFYTRAFIDIPEIEIPQIDSDIKHVYMLYVLFAKNRDRLLKHCIDAGIEAKVHYPIPLYCQDALKHLGYTHGDFPETDRQAQQGITFPVDQHMNPTQLEHVVKTVQSFYG